MPAPLPLRLVGAYGSPYTRKMRAVLRYRRIPFRWVLRGSPDDVAIPEVPVALIPVLVLPGADGGQDEAMIDSTPMIRRLEREWSERAVVPPDPALAFLDALVEDYADEWLTKAMFHYRWAYPEDVDKASRVLPLDRRLDLSDEEHGHMRQLFAERQIARLSVVGSNETTAPVIEESYRRLLAVLEALWKEAPFSLGARPAAGDFGLFGQLTQLVAFDPTPSRIAAVEAPRVVAWVSRADDLSWLEPSDDDWLGREASAARLRPLLAEIGRVYAPFLLANARALEAGSDSVEAEIDGRKWVQRAFPYQGKCLRWLREAYEALAAADRRFVDDALAGSGCGALLATR